MSGYLCNLVIPGAAKSGTTTLHDILDRHPRIAMSRPKEPQFFSFDERYEGGAAAHNALFESGPDIVWHGESSQCYFVHPHAMERMKRDLNDPKIIVMLRDPLERILSHHRFRAALGIDSRPLRRKLEESGLDTGYEWNPDMNMYAGRGGYISFSKYATYVPLWQEMFGKDDVLVLRMEDLKRDSDLVAARAFRFLGLEPADVDTKVRSNETMSLRRRRAPAWAHVGARLLPEAVRRSAPVVALRRRISRPIELPPDELSPEDEAWLRERLAPDIAFYESIPALSR